MCAGEIMASYEEIKITSDRLIRYFRSRASAAGVVVNPIDWDENTIRLAEIVYAEESASRSFRVYPTGDLDDNFHGFVKRVGLQEDNILVGIFSGLDDEKFPTIWNIYLKWMHQGISEEAVSAILAEANAGST